jgi:outer membrane lipoprotein-sorting protein
MKRSFLKQHSVHVFIALYVFLLPLQSFSSEKKPEPDLKLDRVIKRIKAKEKSLKTVIAKYKQIKKTYLLHEPLHSEGLIYYDSSGKLLMKVTSPSPFLILFKNNTFLVYYPEISKAEERYVGNVENIIGKYLGIGQPAEALKEQYEIQPVTKTNSGGYYLKMIPQKQAVAKHIDSIEVFVNPETWLPEQIVFTEVKGDQTTLWLQFISINQPLPPGIFSIALPDIKRDDDGDR